MEENQPLYQDDPKAIEECETEDNTPKSIVSRIFPYFQRNRFSPNLTVDKSRLIQGIIR